MRVVIHERFHDRGKRAAACLAEGFRAHGIDPIVTQANEPIGPTDVAVVWGANQLAAWGRYQASGTPLLVAEHGYVGVREHWTSLGWNGLNGRAAFPEPEGSDRWDRYFAGALIPWRGLAEGPILLVGQVPSDASVRGVHLPAWLREQAAVIRSHGREVCYRPHPLEHVPQIIPETTMATGDLEAEINRCVAVVTYSSTVGVQTMLGGFPTMAAGPSSMAYGIAPHSVATLLEAPTEPVDRAAWAHQLAYCQWSDDEIRRGDAWAHLSRMEIAGAA